MRYFLPALAICLLGALAVACDDAVTTSPEAAAMAGGAANASFAKYPVKTDTKTCEVSQTVTWDGEIWVCTDMPSAAIAGWEFQKRKCTVAGGQTLGCRATCNPGKKILGGGYSFWPVVPGKGDIEIPTNKPVWVDEEKAWYVVAVNHSSTAYEFEVYGLCARMGTDF